MTQEEIIRMAREVGYGWSLTDMHAPALERFAALVAAEREECARACEETTAAWTQYLYNNACVDCAAAIRARGQE